MFASKTPEAAGFTPQPYRFYFSGKSLPESHLEGWKNWHTHAYLDEANQWRGLQSNPPNPILVMLREAVADWGDESEDGNGPFELRYHRWLGYVENGDVGIEEDEKWDAYFDHARAVLDRLVAVYS